MSNNGGATAHISHVIQSQEAPPTNLNGDQKKCQFPSQTDYVNVLTWSAPACGTRPAFYEIYRNSLTNLIGTIPGKGPLIFKDHNRKKNKKYTYYVVAVSISGLRSEPGIIQLNMRTK